MALTTVDYNSYFNYKLSGKQITFTDKTDFVGQGTVAGNVTVVAKITAPVTGVFYNNTNHGDPDIDCGVSLDSIKEILLPLDLETSLPEQGEYTIELTYVDSIVPATVVETRTFTLDYESPSVDLTTTVDCLSPILKTTDDTAYTKNTVNPTITRAMAINYPLSLGLPAVTGTANSLSTQEVYVVSGKELEYSTSLTANISYLFDVTDSMYVIDEVSSDVYFGVACDGDLCSIYCAIRSQYLRWIDAKAVNTTRSNIELAKFQQITSIAGMVGTAMKCGKGTDVSEYVAEILKIADADGGCGCNDGEPQLVTGLGMGGSNVVVEAGTGMTVSSVDGGGLITYTVSLSSSNIEKLGNLTNTILQAGTGTTVTSTTATVGGVSTTTYTISALDTIVESSFVKALMTINASTVPTITLKNQKQYGTLLTAVNQSGGGTDFINNNNAGNFAQWGVNFVSFSIENFSSGLGEDDFFPEVQFVSIVSSDTSISDAANDLIVEIINSSADAFEIRFSDQLGNPVNGTFLQDRFSEMELIFKINA